MTTSVEPARAFSAVLFDMDGTLIDSEPVWVSSIRSCFAALDISVTPELEARTAGLSNADGIRLVLEANPGVDVDARVLAETITEAVAGRLLRQPCAMPGADALLRGLHTAGLPLALLSSSPRRLIDSVLDGQRWDGLFQLVLSVEEVGAGKPDPTIYREALRRLSVAPADALAVEDTLAGVLSARGAGVTVACIPSYAHERERLAQTADALFPTLAGAASWILAHGRRRRPA